MCSHKHKRAQYQANFLFLPLHVFVCYLSTRVALQLFHVCNKCRTVYRHGRATSQSAATHTTSSFVVGNTPLLFGICRRTSCYWTSVVGRASAIARPRTWSFPCRQPARIPPVTFYGGTGLIVGQTSKPRKKKHTPVKTYQRGPKVDLA